MGLLEGKVKEAGEVEEEEAKVEIKELPVDQWHLLKDAFDSMNSSIPSPATSGILVAIDSASGKILGFVVLQTFLHAEPLFIYPEAQHRKIWADLYDAVDQILPNNLCYFITTENPAIERLALNRGFISVGKALAQLVVK